MVTGVVILVVTALWALPTHAAAFSLQIAATPETTTAAKEGHVLQQEQENQIRRQSAREQTSLVWKTIATATPKERPRQALKATEGDIPSDLTGTFYVNGLASCQVSDRLVHPFESHGFFKAIHFPGGGGSEKEDNKDEEDSSPPALAYLQARYVESHVRKLETLFNRPLFRGAMSAIADTSTLLGRLVNALSPMERETANLAVQPWAGKLLVAADNCPFFQVDPETLETIGVEDFGGALKGHKMLAHTRVDKARNRLVTCALKYDIDEAATVITFFEFDEAGELVSRVEHKQSPAVVFHDWMITPNYYVVPGAAIDFDTSVLPDLVTGKIPAINILTVDEQAPASVLLIPRNGNQVGEVVEASMDDGRHGVNFHLGPCHEETNEQGEVTEVVMYPMVFQKYQFGGEMGFMLDEQRFDPTPWAESNGGPMLEEWRVKLSVNDEKPSSNPSSSSSKTTKIVSQQLNAVPLDMPTFHPDRDGLPCRYMYSVCGVREFGWFPFNAIAKHDLHAAAASRGDEDGARRSMQVWPPKAGAAVRGEQVWDGGSSVWGEPLFVPRTEGPPTTSEEDDGYVLSTRHDAAQQKTSLNIFDAQRLDAGPVAVVDLGELWGWTIHTSFAKN